MKVVFVVLHYESLNDTKKCIDSLKKYLISGDVEIVVIDNGSVKGKLSLIETDYRIEHFHFLYSEENLGFARGNNIGFKYAKEELKADVIILCNNDLVFEQNDFVNKLIIHVNDDLFDVAGPRITSLVDGKNQNPIPYQYSTLNLLNKRIIKYEILYFLSFFNLDVLAQKVAAHEIEEFHPKDDEPFMLFGACLIFANNYLRLFNGLYDQTFMYNEESILKERAIHYSLKMCYLGDIEVFHKEGSSTQTTFGKGRKKRRFYYKWNLDSCRKLRRIKNGIEDSGEKQ